MTDLNCVLAGLTRLLGPLIMLILWHRKTGARILPAIAALLACFPVFIIAGAIRSGFDHSQWVAFHLKQGLLYGVFEEGAKFLMLRYLLTSYDNRRDVVTYGIGHCAFEEIGAGMACLNLIGTDRAAPDILWVNIFAALEGAASAIALTVLIFYGIQTGKSKIMLPLAMLLHFISNFAGGALTMSVSVIIRTLLTAGECFAAYRCYKAMQSPFEDEIQTYHSNF